MPIFAHRKRLPTVHDTAFVAQTANLIGEVHIGQDSSVWFGAVLRGDVMPIRIGARTSIQDNSVVHATRNLCPTVVGSDVTVGHGAILHGCTVEDRVLVGMGTIILDEARIPSDCIVGAGSLITTKKTFPPGSLIMGRPAKVVRPLTEEETSHVLESAAVYVAHTREYRSARDSAV